jgi:hypothetical protein
MKTAQRILGVKLDNMFHKGLSDLVLKYLISPVVKTDIDEEEGKEMNKILRWSSLPLTLLYCLKYHTDKLCLIIQCLVLFHPEVDMVHQFWRFVMVRWDINQNPGILVWRWNTHDIVRNVLCER